MMRILQITISYITPSIFMNQQLEMNEDISCEETL